MSKTSKIGIAKPGNVDNNSNHHRHNVIRDMKNLNNHCHNGDNAIKPNRCHGQKKESGDEQLSEFDSVTKKTSVLPIMYKKKKNHRPTRSKWFS